MLSLIKLQKKSELDILLGSIKHERDNNRSKGKEFVMRFKDITIEAEDLECDETDTIHKAIKNHILDVGIATRKTLTGFNWRLDVRMRMDNDDT